MKPREWWIKQGEYSGDSWYDDPFYSCVWDHKPNDKESGFVHVIEKSAYDRLEAMSEKIGSAAVKLGIVKDLYNPDYIPSVRDLIDAEDEFRKILEEYRAMKGEKNE